MIKVSHIIVSILIHAAVIAAALAFWGRLEGIVLTQRHRGTEGSEKIGGGGEVEYFELIEVDGDVLTQRHRGTEGSGELEKVGGGGESRKLELGVRNGGGGEESRKLELGVRNGGGGGESRGGGEVEIRVRYPRRARREGREGEVKVQATVEPGGRVSEARIVKSSGHEDLDAAALKGVEGTRLEREMLGRDGAADERRTIIIPVVFRIND